MSAIELKVCPVCGHPAKPATRPFCSVRCADVDLGRWLTGSYAIPVPDDEIDDEEEVPARPGRPGCGHDGSG